MLTLNVMELECLVSSIHRLYMDLHKDRSRWQRKGDKIGIEMVTAEIDVAKTLYDKLERVTETAKRTVAVRADVVCDEPS